ncbi:MAG TPA: deaminase, partial [Terriglobales bacterium]|nr:deaminase [Terriglobales bacterium]
LAAIAQIAEGRSTDRNGDPQPRPKYAYIIRSLKRPEEVTAFRRVYRPGFYLVGVFATEEERRAYLVDDKGTDPIRADAILERDQQETSDDYGQRTRDTFHRSDVFVQLKGNLYKKEIKRFLDLVFGHPFITPTPDEYAMFLAAAAASRSSQWGRQVGAAIMNSNRDVVALGCNEVPRAGGGSYWEDQFGTFRDHEQDPPRDSNDEAKKEIAEDILTGIGECLKTVYEKTQQELGKDTVQKFRSYMEAGLPMSASLFKQTKLFDITEFGRATHAEMDALLGCARSGINPQSANLYTTTFPCHNCTRHIIAAGIKRVVYIEPYPKSKATDLHGDAIKLGVDSDTQTSGDAGEFKIPFVPFVGVGPRRFLDLFSMELSSGYVLERKRNGQMVAWNEASNRGPRVSMLAASYLDREEGAVRDINELLKQAEGADASDKKDV